MYYFILAFFLGLTLSGAAQQGLPNPDFETWDSEGGFFSSYEDPAGWGTVNGATVSLGITTATRATAPQYVQSGESAVKLETEYLPIVNRIVPGICVTGSVNIETENVEGGIPFQDRPAGINGWFQYFPAQNDTGQVGVVLTRWNQETNSRDTIGTGGFWALGETSTYTFFSGPIEYFSELSPDTLVAVLVSSSRFEPRIGSTLYVDNLNLEYGVTDVLVRWPKESRVYPNPVRNELFFEVSGAKRVDVIDQGGKVAEKFDLESGQQNLNVSSLLGGYYLLRFFDGRSSVLTHARIIVSR